MKNLFKLTLIILALTLNFSCEKSKKCPEGMHEFKMDDGSSFCVPDDLDKE